MIPTNDYLPMPDEPPAVDDRTLDLLVDGELSPAARRELLIQLDRVPDGWRRCALAFLEAQSWREEFGSLSCPAASRPIAPAVRPAGRRYLTRRNLGTAAAMASFLLALVLSFQMRYGWDSPRRAVPAHDGGGTQGGRQRHSIPETDAPPADWRSPQSLGNRVAACQPRIAAGVAGPGAECCRRDLWQHFLGVLPKVRPFSRAATRWICDVNGCLSNERRPSARGAGR